MEMDDLISRQALLKTLNENKIEFDSDVNYFIMHAPSVNQWIPIKTRPMTAEERTEWSERLGYDVEYDEAVIYVSQLPEDGQEVLTCSRYGTIRIDTFENDPDYGCAFEENGDMDGIVAWMPLPDPWKEKSNVYRE